MMKSLMFSKKIGIVTDVFEKNWDNKSLSAWDMNLGDILKVNWKVSFS